MLGHTEHTLAHITLVPVVAVKARDLGEALERLSTLRYSSPPRPRFSSRRSPLPHAMFICSQGRPSVEQLGHSWEHHPTHAQNSCDSVLRTASFCWFSFVTASSSWRKVFAASSNAFTRLNSVRFALSTAIS